jgi:mitochondrial fission protein ELM1
MNALIISDGKPGHFNQSIALCKNLGIEYAVMEVAYRSKSAKACSYALDRLDVYTKRLFSTDLHITDSKFDLLISTGSTTYYANKIVAKELGIPNIAIMHPKGYRLNFSHIFCPAYDHPPKQANITELPLNLCAADSRFFQEKTADFALKHQQKGKAVGIIIGGNNSISELDAEKLKIQLEQIFRLTEGCERWVSTSRRTPKEIEALIESLPFDYKLINSRDAYNPIPAFIQNCERLFVTSDSASMISECASFGTAKVEVLMNRQLKSPNKFEALIHGLEAKSAVHIFDGTLGRNDVKINLIPLLKKALAQLGL